MSTELPISVDVVVSFLLILFLIHSEIGSQDCLSKTCHNSTPEVTKEDSIDQARIKLIATLRKNHFLVAWRRALILALIITLIFKFTYIRNLSGRYYWAIVIILFVLFYAALEVPQKCHWKHVDEHIEDSLLRV